MSADSEPASPAGPDPEPSAQLDAAGYAEMFDAHAAHLFDYCNRLLGDEAEAASVTAMALTTAQSLLQDDDRLRAWLFALARRECLNVYPGGADGLAPAAPTEVADDLADAEVADPDLADTAEIPVLRVLPTFDALTDPEWEVRDLVYRHGIRPEDVPLILGVTADRAGELLAAAELIAELPLSALPASVGRPTVDTVQEADPGMSRGQERLAEFGPTKARLRPAALPAQARQRVKVGAGLLVAVAAMFAAVIYIFGPSASPAADHTAGSPRTAASDPPDKTANGPLPVPSSSSTPRVQISALLPGRAKAPVYLVLQQPTSAKPTASKTAKPKPTPTPTHPTTGTPTTGTPTGGTPTTTPTGGTPTTTPTSGTPTTTPTSGTPTATPTTGAP